jgi:hypothetical protein
MKIRAITANNDWIFGQGLGSYATGQNAVAENIKTRLQEWVGDCFWALQSGVDWANLLSYGQSPNLKQALDAVTVQSYGVISLTSSSLVLDHKTRRVTYNCAVTTIFSQSFTSTINLTPILQGAS